MAYIDVGALAGVSILAGIDPVTREMFFSASTANTTVHPIDVYKEMRICRRLDEDLRPYDVFLSAFGNVPKGGGKFTERYVQQNAGTRFIPYDGSHELTINGTIITDDGQEGVACFDRSGLSVGVEVDINYVPPQVEVIVASSPLTTLQANQLEDVYDRIAGSKTLVEDGDSGFTETFNGKTITSVKSGNTHTVTRS